MATTVFIDTNKLERKPASQGQVTEILNEELAGARNVVGMLRRLGPGETFSAEVLDKHQLIYVMQGKGNIYLQNQDHDIGRGMGVYLGPSEYASISATSEEIELLHLVVRQIPK